MQITGSRAGTATVSIYRTTEGQKAVRALFQYESRKEWRLCNAMTLRFAAHVEEHLDQRNGVHLNLTVVPQTDIDAVDIEFVNPPSEFDLIEAEQHFRKVVEYCQRNNFV